MKIKVNGSHLYFDVYGPALKILPDQIINKPTLIVLHGGHGFADHTLYVEFWSQFQDLCQVIFIDQHGCGRSDPGIAEQWNLKRWANDIIQFCRTLSIEKPIIAGVSMGGHVICELIHQQSDILGGAIFCNTEAHFDLNQLCDQYRSQGHQAAADTTQAFFTEPNAITYQAYCQHALPLYAKNAYSKAELARCIQRVRLTNCM